MPLKEFFVRSTERIPCPCCGGALNVIGSRRRRYIDPAGAVVALIIRRLRCRDCRRVHHELPDILVPYKRHSSESIESVVSAKAQEVSISADDSTLFRLRCWFLGLAEHLAGCLQSVFVRYHGKTAGELSGPPQSALQRIWKVVGDAPGWLARVVRPLVNMNLWVHTRSAFLS
jgi:hypothetical protein